MNPILAKSMAVAPEPELPPAANPRVDDATYQVLVSYYDGADFNGEWRWSAECPALGCASDGRTRQEALQMVADAMQGVLADYPVGERPPQSDSDAAIAQARGEYDAAGWRYTLDEVVVSGVNPYR